MLLGDSLFNTDPSPLIIVCFFVWFVQVTLFVIGFILGFAITFLLLTAQTDITLWLVLVPLTLLLFFGTFTIWTYHSLLHCNISDIVSRCRVVVGNVVCVCYIHRFGSAHSHTHIETYFLFCQYLSPHNRFISVQVFLWLVHTWDLLLLPPVHSLTQLQHLTSHSVHSALNTRVSVQC